MTSQSIYTEYTNLTPDHIQWLDGCGEISPLGSKASEITPISNHSAFILVSGFDPHGANQYFACGEIEHCESKNYAHIPTGSEFCERVAEILGIDKPVFASDLKDKLVKKLEMHDRMERPLPEDKGLVIEVNLLSEEDKKFLTDCDSTFYIVIREATRLGYAVSFWAKKMASHARIDFYRHEGLRITTDPNEFMRYVAAKTGKEWEAEEKPPLGLTPKYIHDRMREQEIQEAIDRYKLANKEVPEEWLREHFDLISKAGAPSYPHRTYRVLDSLDGIPFDTRIPLSEWIPPFGVDLIFISDADWYRGIVHAMDQRFIYLLVKGEEEECIVPLDGHWMRIV